MIPAATLAAWEAAYRAAEYRVELPRGDLLLRVGLHVAADAQRLRDEAGVQMRWAIVTPCNPGSQRLSPEENEAVLEQLDEIVVGLGLGLGLRTISTRNHDPAGAWPDEPGVLICDPPPGFAEELGQHFQQNAILAAGLGEAPRLVWLIE